MSECKHIIKETWSEDFTITTNGVVSVIGINVISRCQSCKKQLSFESKIIEDNR